jgi:uncharacterized protein involved in outer membrane biogenesis
MLKRILKWVLGLLVLAVVLVVILFLSFDSILRVVIEHNIRKQTGMKAEIGKFHLGLTRPVVEIKNLQLFNPPAFGGTPFLNIPEIYVEYDRSALASNQIHITLLRFDLGELDVVKSQGGQTNIFALGMELPSKQSTAASSSKQLAEIKQQTGLDFKGIDRLDVSVGTFKYVDQQDPKNNLEQKIALNNCIITNVASVADLVGLGVVVGLRSGDFFKPLVDPNAGADHAAQDVLKLLGH